MVFQINRDAVAGALNECEIDVSVIYLCIKCSEDDLFDILKDQDFVKHFPVGIMPCGENEFPVKLPPGGDALSMAKKHEIYKSVDSTASVTGLSYFTKHSCPMGENVMIFIWCNTIEEFMSHALTILNRIVIIQKKQSNMFLHVNFRGPSSNDVRRYLYPILGDIYISDVLPGGMRCILEAAIPDRLRGK